MNIWGNGFCIISIEHPSPQLFLSDYVYTIENYSLYDFSRRFRGSRFDILRATWWWLWQKCQNWVILASKSGHFGLEIAQKIHEIIKLELKSFLVEQSACFYLYSFRFESFSKIGVCEGHFAVPILKEILTTTTALFRSKYQSAPSKLA